MNNRVVAGLLAVGFIVGGIATYPAAKATENVKTVTKTKSVPVKISTSETAQQVVASLGNPSGITKRASAADNYVECAVWENTAGQTPTRGTWVLQFCVKTQ